MKIVAFGHRTRVGKDSCGRFLHTELRVLGKDAMKMSFASRLKKACHDIWAWAGVHSEEHYERHPEQKDDMIEALGMSARQLWIKFGTPMCREMVHDLTWVNATLHQPDPPEILIISDLRFPNEMARVRELGGVCVKIDRDVPALTHENVDNEIPARHGMGLLYRE